MSNINLTCDVCGRELQSWTWISGMRFCAKCYQETFGASKDWQLLDKDKTIAEQRKQIADLETKLAEQQKCSLKASAKHSLEMQNAQICIKELEAKLEESEKKYGYMKELWCEERKKADNFCTLLNKEIAKFLDVEQQLAEKDKEIKILKLDLGMFKSVNEFINGYGIEKAREVLLQSEKTKNQDKISFCIEKLEKVKELVEEKSSIQSPFGTLKIYASDVGAIVDSQIEELKKETK